MDTSINPADLPDQIPAKKKSTSKKEKKKKKKKPKTSIASIQQESQSSTFSHKSFPQLSLGSSSSSHAHPLSLKLSLIPVTGRIDRCQLSTHRADPPMTIGKERGEEEEEEEEGEEEPKQMRIVFQSRISTGRWRWRVNSSPLPPLEWIEDELLKQGLTDVCG